MYRDGTVTLLMVHDTGVPRGATANRRVRPPVSKSPWNRDPTRPVLATPAVWRVMFSLSDIPPSLTQYTPSTVVLLPPRAHTPTHPSTRRLLSRIEIE